MSTIYNNNINPFWNQMYMPWSLPPVYPIQFVNFPTYEATAAGFSAFCGLNIVSEGHARAQRQLVPTPIAIEDIFYKKPSTFLHVQGQEPLYYIPDSAYDPKYDYDYTYYNGDYDTCTRGFYSYKRPSGWKRIAAKVLGKYENDVWLGQGGWRCGSSPGEWAVSYHGTSATNVPQIIAYGFDLNKCVRNSYGVGIYSTPNVQVAEGYATQFKYKGENYKCILQNRVNLMNTNAVDTINGTYFVTPDEDAIRPYGVCIKKI
jgi:hypothetical protein